MISKNEYSVKREELMQRYEAFTREWLKKEGVNTFVAENIAFFRDGVVNPEIWFGTENDVRPLFILKEVNTGLKLSDGFEIEKMIREYNSKWGIDPKTRSYFEFAENEFDDIQIGKFSTWKKVVRAAYGLLSEKNDNNYKIIDLKAKPSNNFPKTDIPGYNEGFFKYRTGNSDYINTVNRIAVIDIKKIGAGGTVGSQLSKYGKTYLEHLDATKELLLEQIELVKPTVIVCCCGTDNAIVQDRLYCEISKKHDYMKWINAVHPGNSYINELDFCEPVVKEYWEK